MSTAEIFCEFIDNLKIRNAEVISARYGELTAALNKKFRDTESKTDNTLQVGSFGRRTGINGISDLDWGCLEFLIRPKPGQTPRLPRFSRH